MVIRKKDAIERRRVSLLMGAGAVKGKSYDNVTKNVGN